ncbi:MAG TPA: HypC/HybG/HupF family hydrogenase formation chaperone [Burkholderiaceae bacterium]|jgi:hydrogenase expression/formation protein HypC|nr:HypC/HybG/HupF family hydrogenase formation chaperone [Burkholderiaceae bacterium]
MCIGIPLRVDQVLVGTAVCSGRGQTQRLNMMLVGEQPPGTWVLAHNGRALRVLTADEARSIDLALDALEQVMNGNPDQIEAGFADLVNRTPQLPPHLRKPQ